MIGLEPSCLFSLRDEFLAMQPGETARRAAVHALLFKEFITREADAGRLEMALGPVGGEALLHGHCHRKAFGAMGAVEKALRLVSRLTIKTADSSCCGMAGSFGYGADTCDVSVAMGELSLLPAVRKAGLDTILIADGTSCRQQIVDDTGRSPVHVARVLARGLAVARRHAPEVPAEARPRPQPVQASA